MILRHFDVGLAFFAARIETQMLGFGPSKRVASLVITLVCFALHIRIHQQLPNSWAQHQSLLMFNSNIMRIDIYRQT